MKNGKTNKRRKRIYKKGYERGCFMKYKIIYDNGKPSEIKAKNKQELKAELMNIFKDIKTDYYAYCDLIILDEKNNDITTSPFISKIIADIQTNYKG